VKTYKEINEKILSGKAVVMDAEEIISYVEKKGIKAAAEEVDVVTTATFGPMCSSGCFLNFGHSKPKIRMTEAWLDDVSAYCGIAAVDVYLGATQIRHNDPANTDFPGAFSFGGGHVIEKLIAGKEVQLFGLSYGTQDYPRKDIRTWLTIDDLNQAVMVNPRNCYQNYNVAINTSSKGVYTYMGYLKPHRGNIQYCSAGQMSPLLNDPNYKTIGIGTSVWLAGAHGHVYAEGTQHSADALRGVLDVPREGSGTLALTGDMKKMNPDYVKGVSLKGYGVSLALGVGIPVPILNEEVLLQTTISDRDIFAPVIDYSHDYPEKTGNIITELSYNDLKSGEVEIDGKKIRTGSMSSYSKAKEIASILSQEIRDGKFTLSEPIQPYPQTGGMKGLKVKGATL